MRYVVNRVIEFGGGSRVTIPIEAYATEGEAVEQAKTLTDSLMSYIPQAIDEEMTVQLLLASLGIVSADHYVTKMPLSEGSMLSTPESGILLA